MRGRTTAAAVGVVLLAPLGVGISLGMVLNLTLSASVEQSVVQRAKDIAAQVSGGGVDAALATAGATPGDTTVIQVLDSSGHVLVASWSIAGEAAILSPDDVVGGAVSARLPLQFVDDDR